MKYEPMVKKSWNSKIIVIFGVFIVLRFLLSNRLPSYLLPEMIHDDAWVYRRAVFMLKGEWLGPYDQFTLIKGAFSPLLLAFSTGIGVTFSQLNTALYAFSCIVFVVSVRSIIKNNLLIFILFVMLLFNPILYALHTGQRVYRIGMGQWELLLIFGCFLGIFLRRHEKWKSLLKWVILSGLALGVFFQTREDGLWIYPFVIGSSATTLLAFYLEKKGLEKKAILFVLPLAVALLLTSVVAAVNYSRYGVPIVNDRSGGNYSKVAADLHLIKPNPDEDMLYESDAYKGYYYNIYLSTMEKALAVSPTLRSAEGPIREAIRGWSTLDPLKSGQLSTDHMLFALRDGAKIAGYYKSLPETEEFYGRVHEELQTAFKNGSLSRRGVSISPLIKPLEIRDLSKALSIMPTAIWDIISFKGVSSAALPSVGSEVAIKHFGLVAGGDYYFSPGRLIGSGWAFSRHESTHVEAGLYNKSGKLINNIPFHAGEDVFQHMLSNGLKSENARMSRFSFELDGYDLKSGVKIKFSDRNGRVLKEIPVDGSSICGEDGSFYYCLDGVKSDSPEMLYSYYVKRANTVSDLYQKFIPFLTILACLAYLVATFILIRDCYKKTMLEILPVWLVLTSFICSFVLLMFSMCIITATSFNALVYWYTAPAFILLLMFCGVSVCWAIEFIINFTKRGVR